MAECFEYNGSRLIGEMTPHRLTASFTFSHPLGSFFVFLNGTDQIVFVLTIFVGTFVHVSHKF